MRVLPLLLLIFVSGCAVRPPRPWLWQPLPESITVPHELRISHVTIPRETLVVAAGVYRLEKKEAAGFYYLPGSEILLRLEGPNGQTRSFRGGIELPSFMDKARIFELVTVAEFAARGAGEIANLAELEKAKEEKDGYARVPIELIPEDSLSDLGLPTTQRKPNQSSQPTRGKAPRG